MGGRGRAGPQGDGRAVAAEPGPPRSVPPPGPAGPGGVVDSVGHVPPPRLSHGPWRAERCWGISVDGGPLRQPPRGSI